MTFDIDEFFDARDKSLAEDKQRLMQAEEQSNFQDFDLDEDSEIFSFEDTLLSIPRAVEGFGRSVVSIIPGVDVTDERFFGRSETVVGAGLENIIQFGLGFVPGLGVAGLIGKFSAVAKISSTIRAAKGGRFILAATEGSIAGAVADFTAFDGHEKNFSSLIESMPALQNPLTQFLATDEEDSDIVGRIKNVLEGFGMGAGIGILMESLRGLKAVRKARTADASPEDLTKAQKGGADPGRADKGLTDALDTKAKTDPDQIKEAPLNPENPRRASAKELVSDTPEGKRGLVKQLVDEGDVDEFIDAVENSKATRVDPNGNPRKLTKLELIENNLEKSSKNITSLGLTEGGAHVHRAVEDIMGNAAKTEPIPNADVLAATGLTLSQMHGMPVEELAQLVSQRMREATDPVRGAMTAMKAGEVVLKGMIEGHRGLIEASLRGDLAAKSRLLELQPVFKELFLELHDLKGASGQLLQVNKAAIAENDVLGALSDKFQRGVEGTPKEFDTLLEQMAVAFKEGGGVAEAASLMELRSMTMGRQVYRATNELFINSILSGFKTIVVQPLSAMTTTIYKPLENMVGGFLTQNGTVIRRSMHELLNLWSVVGDSAKIAWKTAKTNQNFLDPRNALRDDAGAGESIIRAGLLGTSPDSWGGAAMNSLGKLVNLPTRLIKSVDEFSKQLEFRTVIKADAITEALGKGLDHGAAVDFAEDRLKKVVIDGQIQNEAVARRRAIVQGKAAGIVEGKELDAFVEANYQELFVPEASESIERAFAAANEVTLQTELPQGGAARAAQNALDKIPMGRFIVPFFRTPVNIAKFAGQRLDIPGLMRFHLSKQFSFLEQGVKESQSRLLQDLTSGSAERVAEATGRVTTGLGLLAGGGMMASAGLITGRGPSDPNRRKAMTDAGWQPYSFKTPNGYVQFIRMDPLATFFGLMGDMFDTLRLQGEDDDDEGHGLAMAALVSLANNFTQKSFLQGIGQTIDALSDPTKNMSQIVEQYAGAIIPNGLAQAVGLFGDTAMKDTNSILERLMSRTPGMSETATPRRNMLGEVIDKARAFGQVGDDPISEFYGLFVPISYREVTSDTIRQELFNLRHGFSPPKARLLGLDLRDVRRTGRGQSAHDRWSQLHGEVKIGRKSLRQTLSALIKSRDYQRLDSEPTSLGPSPRVALVNSAISRYRAKAFDAMLKEFPELAQEIQNRENLKQGRRRGLSALRNQPSGLSLNIGNFPLTQ